MADLKEKEIETTENVEEVKEKDGALKEVPTEKDATITEEKMGENPSEDKDEKEPENKGEEKKEEGEIEDTEPRGNGVRVEDLITKEEFESRFAALESKYDAVVKENSDLKDALSKMKEKYEDPNFGDYQKKGVAEKDDIANDTFDSYSKQFM